MGLDLSSHIEKPISNARFWLHVDKRPSGCWLWTGKTTNGYGIVGIGGRNGRLMRAHRVAYESMVGPIPKGLDLDHLCRVRNCVNPAHLEPVTRLENLRRSPLTSVGQTHCVRGHNLGPVIAGRRRLCRECHREWDKRRRVDPKRREYMRQYQRDYKGRRRAIHEAS